MRNNYTSFKKSTHDRSKQLKIGVRTMAQTNTPSPSTPHHFFDITYIFSDPFSLKNHRKYSKQIKISAPKTHASSRGKSYREIKRFQQNRQSNILSPSLIQMDQPGTKNTLNIQKTNLLFDNNAANEKIHSKRKITLGSIVSKNTKSFRESQKLSQNNETLANGVLAGRSYNTIIDIGRNPEQEQTKKQQMGSSIVNSQTKSQNQVNKHIKFEQKMVSPKRYNNKDIAWAKSTMIMRNKQSFRLYRPWSPVHLGQSNIYDQNVCF